MYDGRDARQLSLNAANLGTQRQSGRAWLDLCCSLCHLRWCDCEVESYMTPCGDGDKRDNTNNPDQL